MPQSSTASTRASFPGPSRVAVDEQLSLALVCGVLGAVMPVTRQAWLTLSLTAPPAEAGGFSLRRVGVTTDRPGP
jgi:hypothetical protein